MWGRGEASPQCRDKGMMRKDFTSHTHIPVLYVPMGTSNYKLGAHARIQESLASSELVR